MTHLESIQCEPDLSMHRCFVTGLAEETELVRGLSKTLDCTTLIWHCQGALCCTPGQR